MSGYCVWGGPKPNGKIHLCFLNPSLTPCHNMIIREQCLEKHRFFWKPERWLAAFLGAEYKYSYEESQIVFDTM